jgi:competence CoiA-like predicted nuclease
MFGEREKEFHRADIRLNTGLVIEIQNSPIVIKEVIIREKFYGKDGLIWILNAKKIFPEAYHSTYFRPEFLNVKLSFGIGEYYESEIKKKFDEINQNSSLSVSNDGHETTNIQIRN